MEKLTYRERDQKYNTSTTSLPPAVESKIDCRGNENTRGFTGQYAASTKIPDLKVTFINAKGNSEVKLVIEVGFAES